MSTRKDEFEDALRIVARCRRALVQRMARDIAEHEEDFESPFVGSAAAILIVTQRNVQM